MKTIALLCLLLLSSCGLIRAPFKIVGGVAKGTANLTQAAVKAPGKAKDKRKAKKAKEKKREEAEQQKAATQESMDSFPPIDPAPFDTFPETDLPSIDPDLPPLPSE